MAESGLASRVQGFITAYFPFGGVWLSRNYILYLGCRNCLLLFCFSFFLLYLMFVVELRSTYIIFICLWAGNGWRRKAKGCGGAWW